MGCRGVVFAGRAVANMTVHDDHRRPVIGGQKFFIGRCQLAELVGVLHMGDVPPIGLEPLSHVLGEGDVRVAVNGHVVVVEDPAQVRQLEMASKRGGLTADAFHQAAFAAERVNIEVEDVEARLVVGSAKPFAGHGHADACRQTLPKRAGRGFNAGGPTIFGMSGTAATFFAEGLDVRHRDRFAALLLIGVLGRFNARQMNQAVEQHRGVPRRQDEAVAVQPMRSLRVVAEELLPQGVARRRRIHGRAGMTRIGLLNGIDAQRPDRVDRQRVQFFVSLRHRYLSF